MKSQLSKLKPALILGLLSALPLLGQTRYQVGDIVENFTLIDRATNEEVSLYDFEGKIVFLEWFAHWCPFCQAAAADIGPGIVDYYNNLGGTPNGIEVKHIGLNLQGGAESQTQNFVNFYNLGLVLNDFNRVVSDRFQPSAQPIFAIINGVADSPSHQQWELLYTKLGYGDLNAPIETFRIAIDSVQAAAGEPPAIVAHPLSQTVESGLGLTLSVEATSEEALSYQWKRDNVDIPNATESTFSINDIQTADAGAYAVAVTNVNGSVVSEPATIEVFLGFLDTLIAQGVPEESRGHSDDPDGDGAPNALEFLTGTDAFDAKSIPQIMVEPLLEADASYLSLSIAIVPLVQSLEMQVQFDNSPAFTGNGMQAVLVSESAENDLMRRVYRSDTPIDGQTQFSRIAIESLSP